MRVRDLLREFFKASPCPTCEAYRNTIQVYRDHEAFLQSQIGVLESALLKATRLEMQRENVTQTSSVQEPMSTMPPRWNQLRNKLEEKHRRKPTPEDVKQDEWAAKVKALEAEAGIKA